MSVASYAVNDPINNQSQQAQDKRFSQFVADIRLKALKQGISQRTVDKYLSHLKIPYQKVLHSLANQPQDKLKFQHYLQSFASRSKIQAGRELFLKYRPLLRKVEEKYHVPAAIIVAIWGDESDYGRLPGKKPIITSLVTLSFQHHRSSFYQKQLFAALKMLDNQKIPEQAFSYFDGGMGQPSFEPTVYFEYGVDFDQDGFANIWTSLPDVFASIAYYLHKNGWKYNTPWVIAVKLPPKLPKNMSGRRTNKSLAEWNKLGIQLIGDQHFYQKYKDDEASLLVPDAGLNQGYLVFYNFKVLLRWNHSTFEGLSIGVLANRIGGSQG